MSGAGLGAGLCDVVQRFCRRLRSRVFRNDLATLHGFRLGLCCACIWSAHSCWTTRVVTAVALEWEHVVEVCGRRQRRQGCCCGRCTNLSVLEASLQARTWESRGTGSPSFHSLLGFWTSISLFEFFNLILKGTLGDLIPQNAGIPTFLGVWVRNFARAPSKI